MGHHSRNLVSKWEPWGFLLIIALHLVPLFTLHFFPTVDGAAHVYNAGIINGLISGDTLYSSFYSFNTVPEPNWLGHAVLSLFALLLPKLYAEKVFLALYIITLPLSFRHLVLRLDPGGAAASYMIFPFIYSFMFITGFYNFCLSLPLLFWSIVYWLKIKDGIRVKNIAVFSLLMTLLFFCHVFAFACMGLIAGLTLLIDIRKQGFIRKILFLLLAALPGLLLTANFFIHHHTTEPGFYFDTDALIKLLVSLHPIMTYDYDSMPLEAKMVFWSICLLLVLALIFRLKEKEGRKLLRTDLWLLVSIIMLALYFYLPDTSSGGGFISVRMLYLFFIFLLLWLAMHKAHPVVWRIIPVILIYASLRFLAGFHEQLAREDNEAQEYHSVAQHIEEGAIVMPLNYSTDWRHSHFSNYIAYSKDVILLENYEASSMLFPVVWNEGLEPFSMMGDIVRKPPCADIRNYTQRTGKRIDYIVQWMYTPSGDSCSSAIQEELAASYTEVYRSEGGNAALFRKKN